MNLEWFLTRTAAVDPCVLRRAVAAALPVEAPCNAEVLRWLLFSGGLGD